MRHPSILYSSLCAIPLQECSYPRNELSTNSINKLNIMKPGYARNRDTDTVHPLPPFPNTSSSSTHLRASSSSFYSISITIIAHQHPVAAATVPARPYLIQWKGNFPSSVPYRVGLISVHHPPLSTRSRGREGGGEKYFAQAILYIVLYEKLTGFPGDGGGAKMERTLLILRRPEFSHGTAFVLIFILVLQHSRSAATINKREQEDLFNFV